MEDSYQYTDTFQIVTVGDLSYKGVTLNNHVDDLIRKTHDLERLIKNETKDSQGKLVQAIQNKMADKASEHVSALRNIDTQHMNFAKNYNRQVDQMSVQQLTLCYKLDITK
ncbi:hypothetical protein [Numidum massiliense]|uniref:hypothetical protein n=1 Tax=Numidum massiliense TaxID=1522315 RepID=UPI0006D58C24|nr:hypothetical protein [Numidum massiliense]